MRGQVFDDAIGIVFADRCAELVDHLAHALLPAAAIQDGSVHLHIVDAVAHRTARDNEITISNDDVAAFGEQLAAWRRTLDERGRLILDAIVARALTWTPDDARGFGGDWGTWFDNVPEGVVPPGGRLPAVQRGYKVPDPRSEMPMPA